MIGLLFNAECQGGGIAHLIAPILELRTGRHLFPGFDHPVALVKNPDFSFAFAIGLGGEGKIVIRPYLSGSSQAEHENARQQSQPSHVFKLNWLRLLYLISENKVFAISGSK